MRKIPAALLALTLTTSLAAPQAAAAPSSGALPELTDPAAKRAPEKKRGAVHDR